MQGFIMEMLDRLWLPVLHLFGFCYAFSNSFDKGKI